MYLTCYILFKLHASRGLSKLRKNSRLNDLHGEDNASNCSCAPTPPYKDWVFWFNKTCAIIVNNYNLTLTHYFTNNLYGLSYRPHTPDIDVAYSWCPFVVWSVWAAVFTFNPYLLISINELMISIIHLLISINELLISINELLISINELLISINELLISINTSSSTVFIDINNSFIDINKGIIDINNSFIDINKYGWRCHIHLYQ